MMYQQIPTKLYETQALLYKNDILIMSSFSKDPFLYGFYVTCFNKRFSYGNRYVMKYSKYELFRIDKFYSFQFKRLYLERLAHLAKQIFHEVLYN